MENNEFIDKIVNFAANSKDNFISDEDAIYQNLTGMKIYEDPLVGFARADDELFTEFKKEVFMDTLPLRLQCLTETARSLF